MSLFKSFSTLQIQLHSSQFPMIDMCVKDERHFAIHY